MEFKVSDARPPVQIHTCRNCKHSFAGKICNQCGEKVFDEKQLSTKHFIHQIFDFFLHWESKVLKTIKLNFLNPGFITKENLTGIRVPYAKPIQLYLVVSLIFYVVVSKVGVTDYIPSFGDHKYFTLSDHSTFRWAEPLDNKVIHAIDSAWTNKGRKMEKKILEGIKANAEPDGSYKLVSRGKKDSLIITADKVPTFAFNQMLETRWSMFHSNVGTYGKTLIFVLLPLIAGLFFLIFFKKLKHYGSALIFATHFMIYNLCFYALYSLVNTAPGIYINKNLGGWMMKPFYLIFYNDLVSPFTDFVFGGKFEFVHLLFWIPWLFIAFKRLFNIPWWQNILASYFLSKVFFFLLYGVLKKIVVAVTIWSMH